MKIHNKYSLSLTLLRMLVSNKDIKVDQKHTNRFAILVVSVHVGTRQALFATTTTTMFTADVMP